MVSIIGRPAKGKTWQMLFGAHYGWNKAAKEVDPQHDQSRLFVSMEMSIIAIEQRLAAMQTHVPGMDLKHGKLTTPALNKLKMRADGDQGLWGAVLCCRRQPHLDRRRTST